MGRSVSRRRKARALYRTFTYRPLLTIVILSLSLFTAVLEGVGMGFLVPIIEYARSSEANSAGGGSLMEYFIRTYEFLGIPFTLETIIAGVAFVIVLRFVASFAVGWLRATLRITYVRHLRKWLFQNALASEVSYFDQRGSDTILNNIITQTKVVGDLVMHSLRFVQVAFITLMYLALAVYLAPVLTIVTAVAIGVVTLVFRWVLESGYSVGDKVADANEAIQTAVQAGTHGIREVKLFQMVPEMFDDFDESVDRWTRERIKMRRNRSASKNLHRMATAVFVFIVIYVAFRFSPLTLGGLSLYLFAMYRLAPRLSSLNNLYYRVQGDLPHLVRTHDFIEELEGHREASGQKQIDGELKTVEFEGVSFSYTGDELALDNVSLEFSKGEFVAFVGQSGAGKSTVISLLTRMYTTDDGEIRINGTPIEEFDIDSLRSHVAVVRQKPFIFNDTLRRNITIGDRDATDEEIQRVCEIARVDEFLSDLSDGIETIVGDDGVRLSGGQRQRIALARALLKDADVLLLDEATSDLDTHLERDVQEAIESMDRDYAIVTVAHRLSTVVNADRIHIFDDGEIVEVGSHDELIAESGQYADLYGAQSRPVNGPGD